ncbi:unnamed protein product [Bursaphelenchus okinawaensis]|uniref:Uncharacterized protein n=1 Tax=Bursaphelenchus okinawaensis TaxID=465554 RepID=A0A811KB67_9BILA|nr:unnamed protein product [Bursaphelenchus okinawaensis]CAG9100733.1 unnamed protein product [Bursaphelenchus okinawaensis]
MEDVSTIRNAATNTRLLHLNASTLTDQHVPDHVHHDYNFAKNDLADPLNHAFTLSEQNYTIPVEDNCAVNWQDQQNNPKSDQTKEIDRINTVEYINYGCTTEDCDIPSVSHIEHIGFQIDATDNDKNEVYC